jgi:hypothetical protein
VASEMRRRLRYASVVCMVVSLHESARERCVTQEKILKAKRERSEKVYHTAKPPISAAHSLVLATALSFKT